MTSKIYWTRQAREDLRAIRLHIARDAPVTATAYIRRLRASVERLQQFPDSGEVVTEIGRADIREILHGNYRLIYRVSSNRIDVLTVFHSSRLLCEGDF